ncbi:hypothetical protein SAMN05192551_11056 [Tindallia magadiensis]|uniref:Uncharacterized protein n=1 Tax=Tindallia magadiensis TaxID=69895 RepID=A0A1I3GUG7_9FIRM|nr:hypothetical protein [Tindallia magadiensis]SFI27178.1 hypothetical protein SAMN05192551_11056 [Tindallia magadiensis]
MLAIKCSKCNWKLFKYHKIGSGSVIKCHKERIKQVYQLDKHSQAYSCTCGNTIGKDEGSYIKMKRFGFTYSGTKE